MSHQLVLLNGLLRTLGRPSARYMANRAERIHLHRAAMCRAAGMLPVSDKVRIQPLTIGRFGAEWILPTGMTDPTESGVILYIPGGAFSLMSPVTHRGITSRLCRYTGFRVLAINYRKAPEHPFPGALEDVLAAHAWLRQQGIHASRLTMAGDSAGGNLTLAALQSLRDCGEAMPAACALFSPWADLAGTGMSVRINRHRDVMVPWEHVHAGACAYANGVDLHDPRVSPLHGCFDGLPPMLIHASDSEMLTSDAVRLTHRMRAAGGQAQLRLWRNTPHAFQLFAGMLPQARRSLSLASDFLRAHTEAGNPGLSQPSPCTTARAAGWPA